MHLIKYCGSLQHNVHQFGSKGKWLTFLRNYKVIRKPISNSQYYCSSTVGTWNRLTLNSPCHWSAPQLLSNGQASNFYTSCYLWSVPKVDDKDSNVKPSDDKQSSPSIFQRFKDAYKKHGKVLVAVHVATSLVWYGTFYFVASSGINVAPLLTYIGVGEKIVSSITNSGAGYFAVAYIFYKIATPARYTVTLVGTRWTVQRLTKSGHMTTPLPKDSLRNLMKDSQTQVKSQMKGRMDNIRHRVDDVRDEMKDNMKDRMEHLKARKLKTGQLKAKFEQLKEKHQRKQS